MSANDFSSVIIDIGPSMPAHVIKVCNHKSLFLIF